MPIYSYRCESCGKAKDVLQKMSDAPLTVCPFCGEPAFKKQLTAAGFQLKGSGWYATDFKGGGTSAPAVAGEKGEKGESKPESKSEGGGDAKSSDAKPSESKAAAAAPASPAPSSGSGSTS